MKIYKKDISKIKSLHDTQPLYILRLGYNSSRNHYYRLLNGFIIDVCMPLRRKGQFVGIYDIHKIKIINGTSLIVDSYKDIGSAVLHTKKIPGNEYFTMLRLLEKSGFKIPFGKTLGKTEEQEIINYLIINSESNGYYRIRSTDLMDRILIPS